MIPLTSKQRAHLRGLANTMDVSVQVGKDGLTDGVIAQADKLLESRELIKISVLQNAGTSSEDLIGKFCAALKAHPVQFIGSKMVIYRRSKRKDIPHIDIGG